MNLTRTSKWMAVCFAAGVGVVLSIGLSRFHTNPPPTFKNDQRIISLSPNLTELIRILGAESRLVGVCDFCPETQNPLPHCGDLLKPNLERILALQPTQILVLGKMDRMHAFGRSYGIQVQSVSIDSYQDLCQAARQIGESTGTSSSAQNCIRKWNERWNQIHARSARIPHRRCLLVMGHEPGSVRGLMAADRQTFLGEMLELAGGISVIRDSPRPYFQISRESILSLHPDVILELRPGGKINRAERDLMTRDWNAIFPTKNGHPVQIYFLTQEALGIPGPRMLDVAETFQSLLQSGKSTSSL